MNKDKSFTAEEKLQLINEAAEFGVADTMRKYDIPITTYKQWLKKYESDGIDGLDVSFRRAANLELRQLKLEHVKLKKLFVEMQLIIEKQDEIIKQLSSK
ncbi:MAG: transposase [Bacteroidetes bacterium]|nr:transposase [Bacteroidota bacterium]